MKLIKTNQTFPPENILYEQIKHLYGPIPILESQFYPLALVLGGHERRSGVLIWMKGKGEIFRDHTLETKG